MLRTVETDLMRFIFLHIQCIFKVILYISGRALKLRRSWYYNTDQNQIRATATMKFIRNPLIFSSELRMGHGVRLESDIPPQNVFRCLEAKHCVKTSLRAENRKQSIPRNNQGANHSRARTIHISRLILSGCRLGACLKMKSTTYCRCLKKDIEKNNCIYEKWHSRRMENIVRCETAYFIILRKYYHVDEVRRMKWPVHKHSSQVGDEEGVQTFRRKVWEEKNSSSRHVSRILFKRMYCCEDGIIWFGILLSGRLMWIMAFRLPWKAQNFFINYATDSVSRRTLFRGVSY
jgi:hypothetical protein